MFVVYFFSFKNILYVFIFIKNGGVAGGLIDSGNLFSSSSFTTVLPEMPSSYI